MEYWNVERAIKRNALSRGVLAVFAFYVTLACCILNTVYNNVLSASFPAVLIL